MEALQREVDVLAVSTVFRSRPVERPEQADFLNCVFAIQTDAGARALKFEVLRAIETKLGRTRLADKHAPRTIDLDIAIYGDEVIDEPDLTVPDPDVRTRPFVAAPLLELAPELVLPDTRERLASLAVAHDRSGLIAAPSVTARLRERLKR